MSRPDIYQLFAATQGVPEGWRWFALNVVGDREHGGFLIKGAVCTAIYARGKHKGEINWTKRDRATERELFASHVQLDSVRSQWETDTGKCSECGGDGQQPNGWRIGVGTLYRPCIRCKATGKSVAADGAKL